MPSAPSPSLRSLIATITIVTEIELNGAFLTRLLNAEREHQPELQHRRIGWLAKRVLERRAGIDATIEPHLSRPLAKVAPAIRNLLRIAVVELEEAKAPIATIVSNHVEAAKTLGHPGTVGFVNAVLRTLSRVVTASPQQSSFDTAADSHPAWIIDYLNNQLGPAQAAELLASHNTPPPLTLRTNTMRGTREQLVSTLADQGIRARPGRYLPYCITIEDLAGQALRDIHALKDGLAFVQDESASLVPALLDPKPEEFIIDLCSAPGGKSAGIALLMAGSGTVLACDRSGHRLARVELLASGLGLSSIRPMLSDGRLFVPERLADRVLVDAPCSGFGNLGRHKEARWRLTHDDIRAQLCLQQELLSHAASLVKPGGVLVYSTCSIAYEENEGITDQFLSMHPNFVLNWPEELPPELKTSAGYLRTYPHLHGMGGAFAARFQRMF